MPSRNEGPRCPQPKRLEELIDFITDVKADATNADTKDQLQEVVEALDWLHTSLSNRKLYHKKQQVRKKVMLQLLKEKLGDDPDLEAQAERMANKQLSDYVAEEE